MKEIIIIAHLISLLLLLLLQLMTMSLLWLLGLSLRSTLHLAAAAMKHVAHCMPRTRCYCSLTGGSSVTRAAVPSPWAALPLPPLILFLCDESHARLHWLARSHDTLTRVTGRRVNAVSAARLTTRSILILIIIVRSPRQQQQQQQRQRVFVARVSGINSRRFVAVFWVQISESSRML